MAILWGILFCLFLSSSLEAYVDYDTNAVKNPSLEFKFGVYNPLHESSLNLEKLQEEIKNNNIESISELLELLNKKYHRYLSYHTLIYKSDSLQVATFENPRVLVYGEDATFIISFNGSPEQRGYSNLEVMRFDRDKREFFFHEITFKKDQQKRLSKLNLAQTDFEERKVLLDKKHLQQVTSPTVCMTCHTPYKKPNWDSYPHWPGIYGGDDDRALEKVQYKDRDTPKNKVTSGIEYLLATVEKHDRYKYLPGIKEYLENLSTKINGRSKFVPNLLLTEFLSRLNFERFHFRIMNHPKYSPNKVLFAGAVYGCFFDKKMFNSFFGKDADFNELLNLEDDTFKRMSSNRLLKRDLVIEFEYPTLPLQEKISFFDYQTQFDRISATSSDVVFTNLRYVVENIMGDTMRYDSMAFNPGTYDFLIGINHHVESMKSYHRHLKEFDPSFLNTLNKFDDEAKNQFELCEKISSLTAHTSTK